METNNRFYAGIDLHKKYSYITIMDTQGLIHHKGRYQNQDHTLITSLQEYNTNNSELTATVESSYGWYWLADELDKASIKFRLAHPAKINAIVGAKKTDKEDAKTLADLLRCNLLPLSYIPTQDERSMRELLRFRSQLVHQRSTLKRRLHDILAKQNIICEYEDILGKKAIEWLKNLKCPYPYNHEIPAALSVADSLTKQIKTITSEVDNRAEMDKASLLLMTVPGLGKVLSLTLSTEIGNVLRFPNDRALASYAGLVPSVHSSGDKTHYGHIKKGNMYIRWALSEAFPHLKRADNGIRSFYEKLMIKKGKSKAKVAAMHKMLRQIYYMLKYQKPYQPMSQSMNMDLSQSTVSTKSK